MITEEKNYYYAITIGPVVDTISMSSKPLGLWFASYLFSEFSKQICKQLVGHVSFFSPSYDSNWEDQNAVGKFHDRIIFTSNLKREDIENKVKEAIKELETVIFGGKNHYSVNLKEYLTFHIAVLTDEELKNENVIKAFGAILDSMEANQKILSGRQISAMRSLINDMAPKTQEKRSNSKLETLNLFKEQKNSLYNDLLLLSDRGQEEHNNVDITDKEGKSKKVHVRELGELCRNGQKIEKKIQKYYAIVQADGDGIGTYLTSLQNDAINNFSKKLLDYSESLAEKVSKVGGSLIYAGGDDLLALMPVYISNNELQIKHILDFCKDLNKHFKESMSGNNEGPSQDRVALSFGISIFYYKYPLYEAFKKSIHQLFTVAKGRAGKNCIAIYAQKHSGQVIDFVVKNNWVDVNIALDDNRTINLYDALTANNSGDNHSLLYHLMNNAFLFQFALEKDNAIIDNVIDNYFSHISQEQDTAFMANKELLKILFKHLPSSDLPFLKQNKKESDEETLFNYAIQVLRFRKFLVEDAGGRNGGEEDDTKSSKEI